jgi:hypothetical protein
MATRLTVQQVPVILSKLVAKQQNKCAICGHHFTSRDYAVLDHDHKTGFIRGALHNSCNGIEGRIKSLAQRGHTGITSEKFVVGLGKYLEGSNPPKYKYLHPSHKTADEKRLARNTKARKQRATKKSK